MTDWGRRVDAADWASIADELDTHGCALTPRLMTPRECRDIAAL
jgi:uncharacterized protein